MLISITIYATVHAYIQNLKYNSEITSYNKIYRLNKARFPPPTFSTKKMYILKMLWTTVILRLNYNNYTIVHIFLKNIIKTNFRQNKWVFIRCLLISTILKYFITTLIKVWYLFLLLLSYKKYYIVKFKVKKKLTVHVTPLVLLFWGLNDTLKL